MSRIGSKEKVRQFLLANIGRVIESHELQGAADGAVQYSRRLRELREQEGNVRNHTTQRLDSLIRRSAGKRLTLEALTNA
jgi:hypothetical protein